LTEILTGVFPQLLNAESAISKGNTIWGLGQFSSVNVTHLSVPEPGMLSLMSLGLFVAWLSRRRRAV
jgi:hypothetical protein